MILKRLSELSKQEVEEIAKKKFLAVLAQNIKDCGYVFLASLEFCEATRIGTQH